MQPSDLAAAALGVPDREPAGEATGTAADLSFSGLTAFGPAARAEDDWGIGAGTRLGDIVVVRLLAEGGMGRVYEGLQGMPCRTVAVKVLGLAHVSPDGARRFEQEAHIMGRLNHPGIARIYSVGLHARPGHEIPFFVMEHVEGARTLVDHAVAQGLSARQRLAIFREVCAAVAHGHEKGVVHRDLKPGNILVDAQGRPKVIDFGIARTTDSDIALTTMHTDVGQLVGTLLYMAPEQFAGEGVDIDARADVYALGVVLYELLVGRLPYTLSSRAVHEVARAVTEVDPRPLSTVDPRLRGDLTTIVGKCLEKERSLRYATAADLEADLDRYLRGEPIAASRPSALAAVVRLARRHRLAATLAVGAVAALLVGVVGTSLFAVRAEVQRRRADTALRDARQQTQVAEEQRETAAREKARADAEASLARQRLYAANLRSIEACLDSKKMRMARQLHEDNVDIVGGPLPLEMQCLAARLDEALVVRDVRPNMVADLEYAADGRILAVTAAMPNDLSHKKLEVQRLASQSRGPLHVLRRLPRFLAVGPRLDYRPAADDDGEHAAAIGSWLAGPGIAVAGDDTPWAAQRPLASSPSGDRFAVQGHDGVRIVTGPHASQRTLLDDSRSRLAEARFNADASRLAGLAADGTLRLWDTSQGRLLVTCGSEEGTVYTFRFSDSGRRLAAAVYQWPRHEAKGSLLIAVHDAGDGHRIWKTTVPADGQAAARIAIVIDEKALFMSARDPEIRVHDAASGASLAVFRGHAAAVESLAMSPDGSRIASGASNGHVRVWDARRLELQSEHMGHEAPIVAVAFSPDGRSLASGGQDGSIRIWPATDPSPLNVLRGVDGLSAVAFSPDGQLVAVVPKRGGSIELWNARTVERIHRLGRADASVAMVAFNPDGRLLAAADGSAGAAAGVPVWRVDSGELVATVGDAGEAIASARFSPEGARILTVSVPGRVAAWDVAGGKKIHAYAARVQPAFSRAGAVFGLDGTRVGGGVGQVFDATTGRLLASEVRPRPTTAIAASADGRLMAVGVPLGDVHLMDFATGRHLARLVGHAGAVEAVAFTAAGDRLASGGADGTARIWGVDSHESLLVLRGHEAPVRAVMFTSDGRRLVTSSADGTVRIWDVGLGTELLSLPGQREHPQAVALGPDGDVILTADESGRVSLWGLSNAAVIDARRRTPLVQ
jgi:WD40 repeat protein/serine/threonine-protein kinase RIO1